MADVKIKGTVITHQYGALQDGTILKNISEDYAKHLVDECDAAEYVMVKKTETKSSASQPASKSKR
jgi:hypothetical protein